EAVGRKIEALLKAGIDPIYCCGEVQAERESGKHFDVVKKQMHEAHGKLDQSSLARIVVAYEQVWAIGTALTATTDQAQEMHAFIRQELRKMGEDVADDIPIPYGSSCKPSNDESLFGQNAVNGGLLGGA